MRVQEEGLRSKRAVRLADVAALAGVVTMTASRALNNSGYVSAPVRERVLKAAEELGYRPNLLARNLRGNRSNAVGVLLPNIANPFAAELLAGINDVLLPESYTTFLATAEHSTREEHVALNTFLDHRVDGLALFTRDVAPLSDMLASLSKQGHCVVTVGEPHTIAGVDLVCADDLQGGMDATRHLLDLGHRRIAFLGGIRSRAAHLRRYEGYRCALQQADVTVEPSLNLPSQSHGFATQEDGYRCMLAALALPEPPTAVFARNDACAIGALHAAHVRGVRVPQDIAIVGFDDIPLAAYQAPPLTTVAQPIHEQGRTAAQFLLSRMRGEVPAQQSRMMPCHLIVRASTGAAQAN